MTQLNICPVCGSTSLDHFLQRQGLPVHQNLLMRSQSSARQIERGDLNMFICNECGLVFNHSFDLSKLAYGENYDNTQSHSPYFERYLEERVHYLIWEKQVRNSRIVEVGCGKGTFLKMLVSSTKVNNIGYGFDPSFVGPLSECEGRLKFEQRYYGPDCTDIPADVVVCRHVIEHVPSPLDLLRSVRQALINSPQARVFFETPCVEWILRNQVIWDFFYEHCSLFTANSLTTAFELAGFKIDQVQHIFNGQYLWLEASLSNQPLVITQNAGELPQLAKQFALSEQDLKTVWKQTIRTLSATKKVAVWGAGAKGITFVNLMDPLGTLIDCIVDLNPNKQGCYSPGTGHPMVGFQELKDRGITQVILMNPNYQNENTALLHEAKINIEWVE